MAAAKVHRREERGSILIYVLLGIALLALLTAALRQSGDLGGDIDKERLGIKSTELQRYAAGLQQGVSTLIRNGVSETDIRFAHPDMPVEYGTITTTPEFQVFHPDGGNVEYRAPPTGITVTPTQTWEFYGDSDIPQVGSNRAELVMVLPNVTMEFCQAIDKQLGFDLGEDNDEFPDDPTPDCVYNGDPNWRFSGTFDTTPNALDAATFTRLPALQGCVTCGADYHYFYVLLAR